MLSQIIYCLSYSKWSHCFMNKHVFELWECYVCNCKMCTSCFCVFIFTSCLCLLCTFCVPLFVRTTYMQLLLLLSDLKAVLLTENIHWLYQSHGQESQQVRDLLCLLSHVFLLTLFFSCSLIILHLHVWLKGSIFCATFLWLLVSCWAYWLLCSEVIQADSNAGFISKGRLFWIQWLGRICFEF